ncbi:MAG: 4-alpha-glucanotransferase [Puniceicoccales bacterium]|jgi:hypothetical protein|nr:4-alpha-glucanotransferase [Puniceicoccales bacterium]
MVMLKDREQDMKNPFVYLTSTHRRGVIASPLSLGTQNRWGDIGHCSRRWLQKIHDLGFAFWRISKQPEGASALGKIEHGSQDFWSSAWTPNPLYVDLAELFEWGLLTSIERDFWGTHAEKDWEAHAAAKDYLLRLAAREFSRRATQDLMMEFLSFSKTENEWLEPYALFQALYHALGKRPWKDWPETLRYRDRKAIENVKRQLQEEIQTERLLQFFFDRQWRMLCSLAEDLRIYLVASVPLWLDEHRTDIWLESKYFFLDDQQRLTVSAIPQSQCESTCENRVLYPVYRWKRMGEEHYIWWGKRVQQILRHFDGLYIHDFGDFIRYAEISLSAPKDDVRYVSGPGIAFFQVLQLRTGTRLCMADSVAEAMRSEKEWHALKNVLSTFFRERYSDTPAVALDWKEYRNVDVKLIYLSCDAIPEASGQKKSVQRRKNIQQITQKYTSYFKPLRTVLRLWEACFLWRWKQWRKKRWLKILFVLCVKTRSIFRSLYIFVKTFLRKKITSN